MNVLYLNSYFYPEDIASSYLGHNVREAIVNAGMGIVMYSPVPTRGVDNTTRKEYSTIKKHEQWYGGKMVIHRFSLYRERKSPLLRALRYFLLEIKLFNRAVFAKDARKCGIIKVSSTPPIHGLMAGFVKKFRHIPIVYDVQDIFPDSLAGTGLAKKGGLLWKIGSAVSNFAYRNADRIVVISNDFKKNLIAKGVPEEKITVIYNWVDENAIFPVDDNDNELFEEFGVSRDKFRVVYAGNLGNAQNIEIIVNAARRLKVNSGIEFVIFGKGGLEDEIKDTKEKEGLDNLKILPLQPYERVSKVYGIGNVCIVACKAGLGGAAMPSKTWNIMSSGRAVLANFDDGELREILENNHCGIFTKADDLDGFVKAIEDLSKNPEQCVEMGKKGRQFILENLTREVGTQKYIDVIKSVVKQ